jgi:16S rRNA (uracil1498-N3)-methyltransferase
VSLPVFVVDPARLEEAAAGLAVTLDGAEGHHAARVRRLTVGEGLRLVDGQGRTAEGLVEALTRDSLQVRVESVHVAPEPAPRLVVVQALPKGDRGELAVETLTEVGVDAIVPWAASRCIAQWRGDRGAKSLRRWRATALEAGKQSRRSRFPVVHELAQTSEVSRLLGSAALGVVLHEDAETPLARCEVPAEGEVVVVVGPEGGIAPDELARFAEAGAGPYRLGDSVLRTSTAGVVAASLLLGRSARWG